MKTWFSHSIVFGSLFAFSNSLYNTLTSLRKKSFFAGYDRYDTAGKTSRISILHHKFHKTFSTRRTLKLHFSATLENGVLLPRVRHVVSSLMQIHMRSIGIALFLFGFLSAALSILKRYSLMMHDVSVEGIFVGTAIMLLTIPLILNRSELNDALAESRTLGRFLEVMGGVRQAEMTFPPVKGHKMETVVTLLGMMLGLITWWFAPMTVMLYLSILIMASFILYKPEVGIVTIAFTVPLLSSAWLVFTVLWTTFSYLFKVFRGKRVFRMEAVDYFVLAFFLLTFLSGPFSVYPALSFKPAIIRTVLMLIFFLSVNLLRSSCWVLRTTIMLFASSTICALLGLKQTFLSESSGAFTSDALRAMSTFDTGAMFGSFLVLCLPFGFACLLGARYFRGKLWSLISLLTLLGGLFFTLSRGAWLSLVVAMFLFFLVYSKKTMVVAGTALLSTPFWFAIFPSFVSNILQDWGLKLGSSIAYRSLVWQNSFQMLKNFWYCGIGVGNHLFSALYPSYATVGETADNSHHLLMQIAIEYGIFGLIVFFAIFIVLAQKIFSFISKNNVQTMKLIAIASFCGVLALILRGTTDYVWQDSRVFCMFWLTAALGVAAVNSAEDEKTGGEINQ